MRYWENRDGVKNCPSKRNWHDYQGRVENEQGHPSHHQQEDYAENKAIPAIKD